MWYGVVTLSDISKATGAKPRTVQLWADAGVIVPEPGTDREGSGKHREFGKGEVIIACIVAPFAVDKMAIGGLLNIARTIRHVHPKANIKEFDRAIEGIGSSFMFVSLRHFDPVKVTAYSGPLTPFIGIIEGDESNQRLAEFMAHETQDFPMVKILSLNSVLKPLKAMKF
jgi:hypothetical protein